MICNQISTSMFFIGVLSLGITIIYHWITFKQRNMVIKYLEELHNSNQKKVKE